MLSGYFELSAVGKTQEHWVTNIKDDTFDWYQDVIAIIHNKVRLATDRWRHPVMNGGKTLQWL